MITARQMVRDYLRVESQNQRIRYSSNSDSKSKVQNKGFKNSGTSGVRKVGRGG